MRIEVDTKSGFCFGVVRAIEKAEQNLNQGVALYSLGEIVHNSVEVDRLKQQGLTIIHKEDFGALRDATVLIRAHGEPKDTYAQAQVNGVTLIDATCPVVLKLQQRVRHAYDQAQATHAQIVIFGQKGHAEVNGLIGQVGGDAIVAETPDDGIDYTRPVVVFSQTTKGIEAYKAFCDEVRRRLPSSLHMEVNDTICRQVSNRKPHLQEFATQHDVIIFVSGKLSSNGKVLYKVCKEANPHSYMIENIDELQPIWFEHCQSVGVCGATSTPQWLMDQVADAIDTLTKV